MLYPYVDKLMANGNKIFVKSLAITELLGNESIPPTPGITLCPYLRKFYFFFAAGCKRGGKDRKFFLTTVTTLKDINNKKFWG
jgi:hypothetical protein